MIYNDFDYSVIKQASTKEGKETMVLLQEGLSKMAHDGYADCAYCNYRAYGKSFGEILEKLGKHGDKCHKKELDEEKERLLK